MRNKIYYLTRSYFPYQVGGGPLVRTGAVKYLEKLGWDVTVVMPNYDGSKRVKINGNVWLLPFKYKHIQKLASIFERVGYYEDYLDKWVVDAFEYLKDKISHEDIVFATSGGELGMIKLGSLLTDTLGCKFVANFQDPLNYGYMNGLRRDSKFHIGRECSHSKYLVNADLVITSSKLYADILKSRFSFLRGYTFNNYFGYVKAIDLTQYDKLPSDKLRIAYAGVMSATQRPELLYKAYETLDTDAIELYFIGDRSNYKPLGAIDDNNVYFIDHLPHEQFLRFMCENIDVGFVSLVSDYYGACVPSKIYEYINLGLPIIGALPSGDGIDIINGMGYGVAVNYNNVLELSLTLNKFTDKAFLDKVKGNVIRDKGIWSMESKIKEVDMLLQGLLLNEVL